MSYFRGVYKRFPQARKEFPPRREGTSPKGEGGRRSGLKRRRHILLRMEENKQVGVKCKKSLDLEWSDGFKHCHACSEKKWYTGSNIIFRESFIKTNIEDDVCISNLPNEIKEKTNKDDCTLFVSFV